MANSGRNPRPDTTSGNRATRRDEDARDPGAFIGRLPERATETIPGGLGRKDQRVSAAATQPGPASPDAVPPEGHREGQSANDDVVREAGQDR